MAPPATERQLDMLQVIRDLTVAKGHPPTLHELSSAMGMSAPGGAASGIKALVSKGLLFVEPRKARCMMPTPQGIDALAARKAAA